MLVTGLLLTLLFGGGAYFVASHHKEARHRPEQFVLAMWRGDLQEVDRLLKLHPDLADGLYLGPTLSRQSPLLFAVTSRQALPMVQRLLQENVNLNAPRSRYGETALHLAVSSNNLPIVELLLAQGADPNLVDRHGETPLHFAAAWGDEAVMQALLRAGATVDAVDNAGRSPLHLAVLHRQPVSMTQLLLEHGADPALLKDVHGRTAHDEAPDGSQTQSNFLTRLLKPGTGAQRLDETGFR